MPSHEPPTIGITLGDPAGIGPEIIAGALASGQLDPRFEYRVIGAPGNAVPGEPTLESAHTAFRCLEESVSLLQKGEICAVTTAPVCKKSLVDAGFPFIGQTEYFAESLAAREHTMCLTGEHLTVALATDHVPLRRVTDLLSPGRIVETGVLLDQFLRSRGIGCPRIAVAAFNPHAGEDGLLGMEEADLVAPSTSLLQEKLPDSVVDGPHSPDTLFFRAAQGEFDGIVCLYHDQGLIPFKLLDFDTGVNVTLGLPYPRTSPDHGTAFDIAGSGKARSTSMISAINLAAELATAKLSLANRQGSSN